MTGWLIVLLVVGEAAIPAVVDKHTFRPSLTPSTLLGVPYAIVMTLAFLFAEPLGFIPLNPDSVLIWS
ncbi:MAG: hypothetical protein AUH78_23105 [Gemmatimonadetes bacterium 13_1_40CM_4_69_8]|nr:MAG: hypothetical protein AUH78_23105 [Gemmatimonadetes bacterium 13_1_40CM_4_69_8]